MEIPPITVSIESVIHDALKDAVQAIADQYKMKVENVSIGWIDISDHSGFKALVRQVDARTSKMY